MPAAHLERRRILMKSTLITTALILSSVFSTGCIITTDDGSSTLEIYNDSTYDIYQVFVTDENSGSWGPDLLGSDILYPGESLVVDVDCGYYDVRVVDELDAVCDFYSVDLCYNDEAWSITDSLLASCDGW
jgi:hypothetical protein